MECQPMATQFWERNRDAASPVLPAWMLQMGVVEVMNDFMEFRMHEPHALYKRAFIGYGRLFIERSKNWVADDRLIIGLEGAIKRI